MWKDLDGVVVERHFEVLIAAGSQRTAARGWAKTVADGARTDRQRRRIDRPRRPSARPACPAGGGGQHCAALKGEVAAAADPMDTRPAPLSPSKSGGAAVRQDLAGRRRLRGRHSWVENGDQCGEYPIIWGSEFCLSVIDSFLSLSLQILNPVIFSGYACCASKIFFS
jgi:hypothetical protein